jgi:hypothetical protein
MEDPKFYPLSVEKWKFGPFKWKKCGWRGKKRWNIGGF